MEWIKCFLVAFILNIHIDVSIDKIESFMVKINMIVVAIAILMILNQEEQALEKISMNKDFTATKLQSHRVSNAQLN